MADPSELDSGLNFDSVDLNLHMNNFLPPNDPDFSEFINFDLSDMPMTDFFEDAIANMDSGIDAAAMDTQIAAEMKSTSTPGPASAADTTETEVAGQVVPNPDISSASITSEAASLSAPISESLAITAPEPAFTLSTDEAANSSIDFGEAVRVTTPVSAHEGAATTANSQEISPPAAAQELPSAPVNNTPVSTQATQPTLPIAPNNFQTTEQSAFLPLPSSSEVLDYNLSNLDFEAELSAWYSSTISTEPEVQSRGLGELDTSLPVVAGPSGISHVASSEQPSIIENYNMSTTRDMDTNNTTITAQPSSVADALPQNTMNTPAQVQADEAPAPLPLPSEVFTDTSVYTDQNYDWASTSAAVQNDPQQTLTPSQHDAQPATEEFIQAFDNGLIPRTPLIYTTQTNDLNNAMLCSPFVSPFSASPFEPSPASTLSYPQQATPRQSFEVDWVSVGKMPLQPHELAIIGTPLPANKTTPTTQASQARRNKGKGRAQIPATRQTPSQAAAGKRKRSGTDPQEPAPKHIRTNSAPESTVLQHEMEPLFQGSVNANGFENPRQRSYEQPQNFFAVGRRSHGPVSGANGRRVVHHQQQQPPQQYYQLPQQESFHQPMQSGFLDTVFPSEVPPELIAMQQAKDMNNFHNNQISHQSRVHEQQYIRRQQPAMHQQQPVMHHQRPSMDYHEEYVVHEQPLRMHNQHGNMYHAQQYMYHEQPIIHGHQQYMPVQQQQQQAQMQMQMRPQHNREAGVPQPQNVRASTTKKAATGRAAPAAGARTTKATASTQARPGPPPPTLNAVIEATQAGWCQDLFNSNGPVQPDEYLSSYDFKVPAPTGMLMMTEEYKKMGEKHRQQQLAAEASRN
ncbi:hypothetical protein LTR84_005093 [Exophiala bonariae]|uniref:Uncharacterized protein n=1 Tax=Exophiala bonariae TaxID=1690606 RepID=A0AAV9NRC2_9EURO|nr:hypothetical protein LTR84_005093 [Exophiala bonariae]